MTNISGSERSSTIHYTPFFILQEVPEGCGLWVAAGGCVSGVEPEPSHGSVGKNFNVDATQAQINI
jgi:hypothetical protein